MAHASFGRVSRGFTGPLIQREYLDAETSAFSFILPLLEAAPRRVVPLQPWQKPPIIVASDGQDAEPTMAPALGYLIVDAFR